MEWDEFRPLVVTSRERWPDMQRRYAHEDAERDAERQRAVDRALWETAGLAVLIVAVGLLVAHMVGG